MFFTYIVLSIGMYSLQRQKPQVVEVSPVVNVEAAKSKPKKSESIIVDSTELGLEEADTLEISNENNSDIENLEEIEDYDPELYEEISFEDNFDKEYREDVGDSYFEDIEETTVFDNQEVVEISENILE